MYEFFRKLFTEPKKTPIKKDSDEKDLFVVINPPKFPINDKNFLDQIMVTIRKSVLDVVLKRQQLAHKIDNLQSKMTECCVCLDSEVDYTALECNHPLCLNCYNQMINNSNHLCPLCRQNMKIIDVSSKYAIITIIDIVSHVNRMNLSYKDCLAIVYLPPMYDEIMESWRFYDIFYDLYFNVKEIMEYQNITRQIKLKDYIIVLEKKDKISEKINMNELLQLKTLSV